MCTALHYQKQQFPSIKCEIELDDHAPSNCYSVGDVISGHVLLNVSKPFYTYAIRVEVVGSVVVTQGDKHSTPENFFVIGMNVYGKGDKIALSAGPKKYMFSLKLEPSNGRDLPGSLKHSNGFIIYQIVAFLKQQLQSYKQAEKEIMVRGYYNIGTSSDKSFLNPVALGKSGVSFRLNKSAYLIGQRIPFEVELSKDLQEKIASIKVSLWQKTVFNVKGAHAKVALIEKQSVESKVRNQIWTEEIQIPDLFPTQNGTIEICYYLRVDVIIPGRDPHVVETPIKIGTQN